MIVAECIQHRQTPAERIGWSHKAEAVGILWRGVWAQVSSKAEYAGVETRIGRNALTVHSLFVLQSKIHPILEQPAGRGSVILKRHWNMIMDLQRYGRKEIVRNQSGDVAGQYPDRDSHCPSFYLLSVWTIPFLSNKVELQRLSLCNREHVHMDEKSCECHLVSLQTHTDVHPRYEPTDVYKCAVRWKREPTK